MSAATARKLEIAYSYAFPMQSPPRITEEEYESILEDSENKLEFRDGKIVMMAGGGFHHSLLKTNTLTQFNNAFAKRPCRVLDSDMKVKVAETGLNTFPDATVVCGPPEFKDDRRTTLLNPGILVEVLSESTESYDRGEKFRHYRQIPSLNTYVLIASDRICVEVFEKDAASDWRLSTFNGLDATLMLRHYDIAIPLTDLYAKIDFVAQED